MEEPTKMQRMTHITAITVLTLFAAPAQALAKGPGDTVVSSLHLGTSLVGLLVAIVLLFEALAVRRVALGGAIAEKISYVILAIVCLAGSALARWAGNFVEGLTLDQTQLASEVLVIVAMALLAAYFFSVRSAMQAYLRVLTDGPDEAEPRG